MKIQPLTTPVYQNRNKSSNTNPHIKSGYKHGEEYSSFKGVCEKFSLPFSAYIKVFLNNNYQIQSSKESDELLNNTVSFSSSERINTARKTKLAEKSCDFYLSRFSGITCPSCGTKMLNSHEFAKIAEELALLEPEEYLDYLGKYKDYMRPVEKSVYDEIYAISQMPDASKDIRTLLVSLRDTKMPVLQKVQMRQLNKMKALARTLPDDEKKILMLKIKSLEKIIRKKKCSCSFQKKSYD